MVPDSGIDGIDRLEVLDLLSALVDKSLVQFDESTGRYRLLETVRQYGRQRGADDLTSDFVADRHATYFARLAERAFVHRMAREQEMLDLLEAEHDELRAALDHFECSKSGSYLALSGALGWYWHLRSHFAEGRERLGHALNGDHDASAQTARAHAAAGELAAWGGDIQAAGFHIYEAVRLWRELGNEREVGLALQDLGWGYFFAGDDKTARTLMEQSLEIQHRVGDPLLVNRARIGLLQVLVSLGELDAVEPMAAEALTAALEMRDLRSEHFAVHFLADCPLIRGNAAAALPLYKRALLLAVELGDRSEIAFEIQGLAMSAAGLSRSRRALRLAGAASAAFEALAIDLSGVTFWSALLRRYLDAARLDVGSDAAESIWQVGREMTTEQAIEYALSESGED